MLKSLHNEDHLTIMVFGEETQVTVFSTGDNQFDEDGNYKPEGFALDESELACLNWLVENVAVEDHAQAILDYCNEQYACCGGAAITLADLPQEVSIDSIVINVSSITRSLEGSLIYPEISFCGECACDPEHGICIGFRDKRFLGIASMDWTL